MPARPEQQDIAQIALYQRAFGGGTCKLIYANRISHVVHEISQEMLDEAMDQTLVQLRKRQRILERTETIQDIIDFCEVNWGDYRWRDYSPELLLELKQVFSE